MFGKADSCSSAKLVFSVTVLLIYFLRRRTVSRRLVCIVGLSDAGKTLIFSQLIYEKAKETYTTMKANVESYLVPNKVSLKIVLTLSNTKSTFILISEKFDIG